MKKFLILTILLLSLFPWIKDGELKFCGQTASAQTSGGEDGEEYDPSHHLPEYYNTYQLYDALNEHCDDDDHYVIHGDSIWEFDDDGNLVQIWEPGFYDFDDAEAGMNDQDNDTIPDEQDPDWIDFVDWTENIISDMYDPLEEFPEDDPWWDSPQGGGPNNNPNSCQPEEVLAPGSAWVATSDNAPGMQGPNNVDPAEDMNSQDVCTWSTQLPQVQADLSLSNYEVFDANSYYTLKARMQALLFVTTSADGSMWDVAHRMENRFYYGPPTMFEDAYLTGKISNQTNFINYKQGIENRVKGEIITGSGTVLNLTTPSVQPPVFPGKLDGLGITVDNVWSARADLVSLKVCQQDRKFAGVIKYTLTDDYGLDQQDVIHNNSTVWDYLSLTLTSTGFHAWYILQHIRCNETYLHRPFLTRIVINGGFTGTW